MNSFKKIKKIHFVGIGGAGMIGIARVLLQKGYKISGSDISMSVDLNKLKNEGAKVYLGHSKSNLRNVDLLVLSSAIHKSNPEVQSAKELGITTIPRAEMLGSIMRGYDSIAIAGSHGKTTTTSMLAKIFSEADLSPTYVVGGKILSTENNSDLGSGAYLMAEADESDGSFIHLHPNAAIVTNIDDDHLVHYDNKFENLLNAFITFLDNVPFFGYIVLNNDDKNIKKISKSISRKQITFGFTKSSDFQIKDTAYKNGFQSFSLFHKSKDKTYFFKIPCPGKHNVYNAAAAALVSIEEGLPISKVKKGLKEFSGVGRRYEKHNLVINGKSKLLIDDYGHHPLEVLSNIKAIKQEFPSKKVCMIFQPHRFSRTAQLFEEFINVLIKTKALIILDIYAASEKPIKGINSKSLVHSLKQMGHLNCHYINSHDKINDYIELNSDKFDIFVTQGAGSVSNVCESIRKKWEI